MAGKLPVSGSRFQVDSFARTPVPTGGKDPTMVMRIEGPVELWDEAVPLGNGHMGGLLYGSGPAIKLALDGGSLWDERKSPAVLREDFTWKHWLELKAAGRWEEIGALFDRPYWEPTPTKIPGGRLDFVLSPSQAISAFTLDMATGVGRAELAESGAAVECFFSAVDGVAMLRMPESVLEDWKFVPPVVLQEELNYPVPEIQSEGNVRWFLQATPEGMSYATVAGQSVRGDETVIALVIVSSLDGPDPLAVAKARVAAALGSGYEAVLTEHVGWWRRYWDTSRVSVPEEALQRHYNFVSYLLGSGSRRGAPPMPLQGVWTAEGGLPPWKGDYHHNLNTQMTYVSYLTAGHLDEGLAFFDFLWGRLPEFRKFAHEFYGAPGAMLPTDCLSGSRTGTFHT